MDSKRVSIIGTDVMVLEETDQTEISHQVSIVEEWLCSEDGVSFMAYTVSEPLSPTQTASQRRVDTHDSILSVARILGSIQDSITGITILDEINTQLDSFNDKVLEMDSLGAVKEEMRNTLDACFKILHKIDNQLLNTILEEADISLDTLYQLTETYAMENTYEFTYFLISKEMRVQDSNFGLAVASIESLDLSELGISSRFGESLTRAVKNTSLTGNQDSMTVFHACPNPGILNDLIELIGVSNINDRNTEGLTPLLHHCQKGNPDLVVALLQYSCVDYRICDFAGRSVLHVAAFKGYVNVIDAVVGRIEKEGEGNNKEFLDLLSIRGNTALHAGSDRLEVVKALIEGGARAGVKNLEGKVAADVVRDNQESREFLDSCVFLDHVGKYSADGEEYKFATVSRLLNEDGVAVFLVKSLKVVEIGAVKTVKRPLRLFEFLRQQARSLLEDGLLLTIV
ncbi:UNVERIFIED_CONTAM: hypothetical protein HDU68_006426 [Siphonaria sp. JEL0065]|nr:hypothetical protein HDU68_006426 [Siphonaria sp. JEL0065]